MKRVRLLPHRLLSVMALLGAAGASAQSADPVFADGLETRTRVEALLVEGRASAGRLVIGWEGAPTAGVDHYEILATPVAGGIAVPAQAPANTLQLELAALEADTAYSVVVRACFNGDCTQGSSLAPGTGRTEKELWQLIGSGNSLAGLTLLTPDANARLSVTRFGSDSAPGNAGHVQLYFGPRPVPGVPNSLSVASGNTPISAGNPASWTAFTSLAGASGLRSPPSPTTGPIRGVFTGHGVPMQVGGVSFVRLYFEAVGSDNKTRIFSIDSKDGLLGVDFHAGAASVCSTEAEYAPGGACAARVEIGLTGDAQRPNANLTAARQHKVVFNIEDGWRWNGLAPGFMVFTTGVPPACSASNRTHGYALPVAGQWQVEYRNDGCPKLWEDVQACAPVHLGGDRYKMYCGIPSVTTGILPGSSLPFLGPKRLVYGYARQTGDASVLSFDDWAVTPPNGKDVVFLWPDGSMLDDRAEGYIDDYQFMLPTGDPLFQMAYITITDGVAVPIGAAARLLNP
jgi:hypothetical protein